MIKQLLEEYAMLNDTIYQLRNQLLEEEIKEMEYEANLWLNTDFKGLKLTNNELRKAHVQKQMGLYISKVGSLKNDLKLAESELSLCKTKINVIKDLGIDLDEPKKE